MKIAEIIFTITFILVLILALKSHVHAIDTFFKDEEMKPWKIALVLAPGIICIFLVMFGCLFF